ARVVDVPGAFAARGYPSGLRGRITIGVTDDTCPWVDGTWTIEVDGGEGGEQAGSPDGTGGQGGAGRGVGGRLGHGDLLGARRAMIL
ncbi:MAG TPA: sterol carrier protein domain-containing protein, partial [Actinomycetes bacterium]|nr:sterol carrier protein domain-containing protein [Actinomycetes bacterium]